jgi:hypothetical protein
VRVKGDPDTFVSALRAAGVSTHADEEGVMRVFMPDDRDAQWLFQIASQHGLQVRHLRVSVPTLEDVFAAAIANGRGTGDPDQMTNQRDAGMSDADANRRHAGLPEQIANGRPAGLPDNGDVRADT